MISVSPVQSTQLGYSDAGFRVRCRVETLAAGKAVNSAPWECLFERSPTARIHHHPDYAATVVADELPPAWTIGCSAAGRLSSMAILVPKRMTFGRQFLPGAASRMLGARLAGFGLLGDADLTQASDIVETLADEVDRRQIPVVEFEELEEQSALWQALQPLTQRGFRFVPSAGFDLHHRIRLPQSAEEYWSRFKSKSRATLRKKRTKLGDYTVRRFRLLSEVPAFLEAAHAVSLNTWQTHQLGLRVRANSAEARYLGFLAEQGAFRSYVLFREQQPVAFVLSHQWGGVYHYDELGFDRRLAELSPGNVLLQEIIDDLLTHDGPEVLDFGLGDADYKQFFGNEQSRSATVRMFSPGFRGWWQTSSLALRGSLAKTARAVAARAGVAAVLRRTLRDQAGRSKAGPAATDPRITG